MSYEKELPIEEEVVEEPVEEVEEAIEEVVKEPKKKKSKEIDGFYKGYDIKWLAKEENEDHPDRHLVDEYNRKKAE